MTIGAPEETKWPELYRVRRAIVVVDVVESVRLMQQHEDDVIDRWRRFVQEVRAEVLPQHKGRLVKSLGDGMLLEFETVSSALSAARDIGHRIGRYNEGRQPDAAIVLRSGVHVAQVVVDDLDVYGDGVNLAARLASIAEPSQIVVSADVCEQVVLGLDFEAEDLGECYLKHVAEPVRAFRIHDVDGHAPAIRPSGSGPDSPRPTIAVLTLSGEGQMATLGSLLADELAAQLSVQGTLSVISRLSTRRSVAAVSAPLELLRASGSDYGVGGECREIAGQVVVSFELVHTTQNQVVWTSSIRGHLEALVMAPDEPLRELCSNIVDALAAHETRRARSNPIASLQSYSLLIGGVTMMHRLGRRDFDRAHELLQALTERVPRHPDAYAYLAKWHILQTHQGWSADPMRSASLAHDMARRALDRDDECTAAMSVSGMVKTFFERDLTAAEQIYQGALQTNPNDALIWLLKGTLHGFRGEGDLAVEHTRRALALSPLDPMRYYFDALAASAAASAGHYNDAIDLGLRSLKANSMHASTLRVLAISYSMLDRVDEARAIVERMLTLEPSFTVSRFLERAPGAQFPIGRMFAEALARAGVPR